ncbi:MAG: hypothetical protein ACFCU3_07300 [Verrucomicrobiales bacterium]
MKTTPPSEDVRAIGRSILFPFACLVVGLSYLSIRSSLTIESSSVIFADMLGGRPLPALTTFLINYQSLLVFVSCAIPIGAIALVFVRRLTTAFYAMGVLTLAAFFLTVFIWHGLTAPLVAIITGMTDF